MKRKLGFLVNPIAGMGGRVGLKGTDGVVAEAVKLGASPIARFKAVTMLTKLHQLLEATDVEIEWLTCHGEMGESPLRDCEFNSISVVYTPESLTYRSDTCHAAQCMLDHGAELLVFCGGDGTARDVVSTVKQQLPILGIPSGVKMYSGVFGSSPTRTAEILMEFIQGELTLADAEVLDLDEDAYRKGNWRVRLCDLARVPVEPMFMQTSKAMIDSTNEQELITEIAGDIAEQIKKQADTLFLLGAGSTLMAVGKALGIKKTLLGIDAVCGDRLVAQDLNEADILKLLEQYSRCKLVLSPIGAQGFVIGRGNLQLSPMALRKIGEENMIVVATPGKLARTKVLRFDTGDALLDEVFSGAGYIAVQIAAGQRRMVKVVI